MQVLVTAEVQDQTPEGYDGMLTVLESALKQPPGFIFHAAHPTGGAGGLSRSGRRSTMRISSSRSTCIRILPPGIKPRRSFQALHSLVTA